VKHSDITFSGKSGEKYRFQVWSLDTRFKPLPAVFMVTRRAQNDGTYNRASHEIIYIGETANLADPFATESQFECFRKHGGNCICILQVEDEARRRHSEEDLSALHDTQCNQKQRINRLFDAAAPAPTKADEPSL
jgi:hypothetical protein